MKKNDQLFSQDIKEGGLRKQLKMKKGEKLNKTQLNRMLKTEDGKTFTYKGNTFKMTPLMKKRLQLALNMIK